MANNTPISSRDISFTDSEYQAIAQLVHQISGISLFDGKKELIRVRLTKRILALGFTSFKEYYRHVVNDNTGEEVVMLLDAMATNLTSFYREPQHFKFMASQLLPDWEQKSKAGGRIRIWSAACSSGEEPYTIAMVILDSSKYFQQTGDLKILATDISTKVLRIAKNGIYGPEHIKNIPPNTVNNYFTKLHGQTGPRGGGQAYQISDKIKNMIAFRLLNLMDPLPFKGPLDLIFCRNVMIYFDKDTIAGLIEKYYNLLTVGGHLFIGHSESLSGLTHRFKYVAPCIYKKE